jgi:hypothetical protein
MSQQDQNVATCLTASLKCPEKPLQQFQNVVFNYFNSNFKMSSSFLKPL